MATANTERLTNSIVGISLLNVTIICFLVICESYGAPYRRDGPQWNTRKTNPKNMVVFPSDCDETPIHQGDDYRPENHQILQSVPSCQNTTFCEQPAYYPDDLVNLAVQMDDKYKYSATVDKPVDPNTQSRSDLIDGVSICSSFIQIVYPKTAENWKGRWYFVINHQNFMQGVQIEVCRNSRSHLLSDTPIGYAPTCKQRYTHRQLATVLPNGTIKLDTFRFPAGCQGYVKFENLLNRMH